MLVIAIPLTHAATRVTGGTVVYLSSKIPSLNPLHSAYEVGLVTSQIFASLTRMNENNEISPYVAESWEISNGGKTYTFHIAKKRQLSWWKASYFWRPCVFVWYCQETSSVRATDVWAYYELWASRPKDADCSSLGTSWPTSPSRNHTQTDAHHAKARVWLCRWFYETRGT